MPATLPKAPGSKRGAAEICVLHGQRRKRANFESVSTSAIISRKRIGLMSGAGVLFFALLLTALPELRAEKSTTAISPSTLITRLQMKSNWPSSAPVNTGPSTPRDLEITRFI